ncbi:hypothetical protein [Stutzerimonas nitrititolerans]|uniref:hypothetical protein n=1 Tax=Stutzerimonas nitrititolerans TaxID=2482751 RepID=UPI00289C69F6|nr:hypothetical protein [Stutzerimonas nitrititolerans]
MAAFNRFRLFHWLLAGFFLGAYLSGDDAETLHIWLGYGLVALLMWRLLIGVDQAVVSPAAISITAMAAGRSRSNCSGLDEAD